MSIGRLAARGRCANAPAWLLAAVAGLAAAGCERRAESRCEPRPMPAPVAGDRAGMVWAPPGRFVMGSDHAFPEEAPAREVDVAGFWIADHEVTNAEFARFVDVTSYVTVAERRAARAGAAIFVPPTPDGSPGRWRLDGAAHWRRPAGAHSDWRALARHPAVNLAFEDALRYAQWLGHELPTEAQWEYAALGRRPLGRYPWGNELAPDDRWRANTWQGPFPLLDTAADGFASAAPVACYPPNDLGLYDMIGNVWEWTQDRWRRDGPAPARYVVKGGSYLCAPNYCQRYRASARQGQDADLGAAHIGFRTVVNP